MEIWHYALIWLSYGFFSWLIMTSATGELDISEWWQVPLYWLTLCPISFPIWIIRKIVLGK